LQIEGIINRIADKLQQLNRLEPSRKRTASVENSVSLTLNRKTSRMSADVAEPVNVQNTAEVESPKVHASKNYLANSVAFYLYSWSIAQH